MSLIGLDLNATRARAVSGPEPGKAAPIRLEQESFDLPIALSLQDRSPAVGRAGAALARRLPHLACLDFLAHLGDGKTWSAGRHCLDADGALSLVFSALRGGLGRTAGVALALPAYLGEAQVARLRRLAEQARWPLVVSVPTPLAATLAACDPGEGTLILGGGLVLVGDVDGHALTWSAVELAQDHARLLGTRTCPTLGRNTWLRRLLDGVAHRCVRMSRRDPRESAEAEQTLYDQLATLLEAGCPGDLVELHVRGSNWYHQLVFHTEELVGLSAPLVRQVVVELDAVQGALAGAPACVAIVLTPAAARLPGLLAALEARVQLLAAESALAESAPPPDPLDFGESLVSAEVAPPPQLHVLGFEAVARAVHELAARVRRGEATPGHWKAVPLSAPPGPQVAVGPPRLSFRGSDHLFHGPVFTLGRDPACDLVFETELYPSVSIRHCEIVFDRRSFTLHDRSRHGTLLNNRPVRQAASLNAGDWIRLGPVGPVVRFLGQHQGSGIRGQGSGVRDQESGDRFG